MKENIIEEILDNSRTLFNEKGYHEVSMRTIAKASNISVGNLTYHFPHKLDILCALLKSNTPPIDNHVIHSLKELVDYLNSMLEGVIQNAFFFSSASMQDLGDNTFQYNKETVDSIKSYLLKSLKQLKKDKYLENINEEEMKTIIDFWMLSHVTYAREDINRSSYTSSSINEFLFQHLTLLKPYMTNKGLNEYKQLKKELA